PCLMAALLARLARGAAWTRYSSFAGIGAILALFAYASLEIRYLFRGVEMDILQGFEQGELYAYSAAWLTLGAARLRLLRRGGRAQGLPDRPRRARGHLARALLHRARRRAHRHRPC